MADTQQTASTPDELFAAFDAQLEHDPSEREAEPEPDQIPEPTPDQKPAAVVATDDAPRIDGRTREGRKASIQREIDDLSSQRHTTKTEVDAAKAELAALRTELSTLTAQRKPAEPPAPAPTPQAEYKRYMAMPDAPKIETFTGDNAWQEYQFAVSDFITTKRFDERMQQRDQQQQAAAQNTKLVSRIQIETAKDATFQERFNATPVDTRMVPYLHRHPQGEDIMVYLVNHPQDAQRLATLNLNSQSELPSVQQIEAIGEIVGALKSSAAASAGPASKPSPISRAKPVIKPVTASPDASDDDDGDEGDLDTDEFVRRANSREHRAQPRRSRR